MRSFFSAATVKLPDSISSELAQKMVRTIKFAKAGGPRDDRQDAGHQGASLLDQLGCQLFGATT
jgi:hypothetical protein